MKNIADRVTNSLTDLWGKARNLTRSTLSMKKPEVIDPEELEQAIAIVRTNREMFNAAVAHHYAAGGDLSHMRAFLQNREWPTERHEIVELIGQQKSPKKTVETILRTGVVYKSKQEAIDKMELILKGLSPNLGL